MASTLERERAKRGLGGKAAGAVQSIDYADILDQRAGVLQVTGSDGKRTDVVMDEALMRSITARLADSLRKFDAA